MEGSYISKESLEKQIEMDISAFSCATNDPEYLAHMNTPNLVRDLDLIRSLLGLETLDFFGGLNFVTVMGVAYAAMFPDHAGRIVLDGVLFILHTLIIGVPHFPYWMGIEGNALDYYYTSNLNIPSVLFQFASQCVMAATVNPKACVLASGSMNARDPAEDILNRIWYISGNLSLRSYPTPKFDPGFSLGPTYTFLNFKELLPNQLNAPHDWDYFAQFLLDIETEIRLANSLQNSKRSDESNLTRASLNQGGFNGPFNSLVYPAVFCLDSNFNDISNEETFIQYLSTQIAQNALIGSLGTDASMCLGWPNLTSYNVEQFRTNITAPLKNKALVIGETNSPFFGYSSALATYEYLGPENANFLVHDAFGTSIFFDPNNCTLNAIKEYYATGKESMKSINVGILPENGTICQTDHSGTNNIFLQIFKPQSNRNDLKLGLGLGLGIGIPIFALILAGIWVRVLVNKYARRKGYVRDSLGDIMLKDMKDKASVHDA
jgi:hypothetical protein